MASLAGVGDRLNSHDRGMNHTRPHREPDQASMLIRISRCEQQKDSERRVDANDHQQVVRVTMSPCPAGWPDKAEWIDSKNEDQPHGYESDPQRKQAGRVRHSIISMLWTAFALTSRIILRGGRMTQRTSRERRLCRGG